ncbi:MAG: hypothetical protein ACRDLK_09570 [Gaiellaceae bacterium]
MASIAHAPAAGEPTRPAIQIVPLAGLPFAAAAVVGVIVAIAGNWLWAIDFFHVVGGGAWTTLDLFLGFVLGPIIGRMSIPARVEFSARFMPKLVLLIPTLVTMTLASGFQIAHNLGYLDSSYPRHGWVVASFVVVGIMAVIALGYLEPANIAVLFELKKPQPDGEVIAKLMKRFLYTAGITGALQVATLVIMTRLAT